MKKRAPIETTNFPSVFKPTGKKIFFCKLVAIRKFSREDLAISRPPSTIRKVSDNYFDDEDTQEIIFEDSSQNNPKNQKNEILINSEFEMTPEARAYKKHLSENPLRKTKTLILNSKTADMKKKTSERIFKTPNS